MSKFPDRWHYRHTAAADLSQDPGEESIRRRAQASVHWYWAGHKSAHHVLRWTHQRIGLCGQLPGDLPPAKAGPRWQDSGLCGPSAGITALSTLRRCPGLGPWGGSLLGWTAWNAGFFCRIWSYLSTVLQSCRFW